MANKTMHHVVIGDDTFELVDEAGREETTRLKEDLKDLAVMVPIDFVNGVTANKKIYMSGNVLTDSNMSYTQEYMVKAGMTIVLDIGGATGVAGIAQVVGSSFYGLLQTNDSTLPNHHYTYTMLEDAKIVFCFRHQNGYSNSGYICYSSQSNDNKGYIDFVNDVTSNKKITMNGDVLDDSNMSYTREYYISEGFTISLNVGGAYQTAIIAKKTEDQFVGLVESTSSLTPNAHYEYTATEDMIFVVCFRHQTGYINSGYIYLDLEKYVGIEHSGSDYVKKEIKLTDDIHDRLFITESSYIYGNGHTIDFTVPLECTEVDGIGYCTYNTDSIQAVWDMHGGIYHHVELTEKETEEEVVATNNTYAYINGKFVIHADDYSNIRLIRQATQNMIVSGNIEVEIHDLKFIGGTVGIEIKNGAIVKAYNCEFGYATADSGEKNLAGSSFYGYACKAYHNKNDGFNAHGFGSVTELIDCEGFYNYDDGTSQHDEGGYVKINGGTFHHNGGGGIASPTYGAIGHILNVVCHHNNIGLEFAVSESTGVHGDNKEIYIQNVACHDNTYGIYNMGYDAYIYNSYIKDNVTNVSEGTTATDTFVNCQTS